MKLNVTDLFGIKKQQDSVCRQLLKKKKYIYIYIYI